MILNLTQLFAKGGSRTIELKRSTGELREAMQTLCAFPNGKVGRVLICVKASGEIIGQQVSEQTLHELAIIRERMEPPAELDIDRVDLRGPRRARPVGRRREGLRPLHLRRLRLRARGNTTHKMPQELCEALQRNPAQEDVAVSVTLDCADTH